MVNLLESSQEKVMDEVKKPSMLTAVLLKRTIVTALRLYSDGLWLER